MKKTFLVTLITAIFFYADAQIIKRMADRAKNKLEQKAGEKIDKGIDDAVDGKKKEKKKTASDTDPGDSDQASSSSKESSSPDDNSASDEDQPSLKAYSKYDFVPGEKIIAVEDFSDTEAGDFPMRWNTNSSGEVVTLNNKEGKWLKVSKQGSFHPEFITHLPENFTLEFDLGVNDEWNSYPFTINFVKLKKPEDFSNYGYHIHWLGDHAVQLGFKPSVNSSNTDGESRLISSKDGGGMLNSVRFSNWNHKVNTFAHISIWRQKQRLRVYLNGEKIWDLPRAFDMATAYNAVTMGMDNPYRKEDFFLLANLRLAVGAPDTRSKLITEGKFVTRGILFDVNSDVVKAESYGTIKDIANVLNENNTVRVKIIGHTDSDGDDKSNLELSKKRAAAVRNSLINEFGIEASRIETDGKGESQPVDKSETVVGKANNRRVEFVKL